MPAAVKSKGTLTVAMDATYAPDEFIAPDGSTIVGMDADLATAITQVLGLKVKLVNATFDTIIPGIQSGKYDMGASSFTDTIARQKVVDFVDYFTAGEGYYVKSGSPLAFNGLASLCGHSVAVESGTTEESDAKAQAKKCTSGKVTVLSFGNQSQANLAVSSGRADVGFADSQVAGYIVATSNGVFQNSGTAFEVAPYGLALPKGNGMAAPVQAAVNYLIANGVYSTDPDQVGRPVRRRDLLGHQRRHQLGARHSNEADGPPDDGLHRLRQPSARGRARHHQDRPVRHPGRWVASAVILVLVAMLVNTLFFSNVVRGGVREGRFQWPIVWKYLFVTPVLKGIVVTLELTVIAMVVGVLLGVLLAVMRLSPSRLLSGSAWIYIWFFRGTPVLVQLTFWYVGITYLYPKLTFGIPFGPAFFTVNANSLVTSFIAAALGLSLNEGAYMAEIVTGRDHLGGRRPDRGRPVAGHDQGADTAPDRAPPGHARHHPSHRQRDHLHAEDHLVGHRDRRVRPVRRHAEHLQRQLRDRAAPVGGQPVVPVLHLGADHRAVLRGALLRPGLQPHPAADATAATAPGPLPSPAPTATGPG